MRERERERGNQELYKERLGVRVNNKGGEKMQEIGRRRSESQEGKSDK